MALQPVRYPANPNLIVYFDAKTGTFYLDSAGKYPVTGPSSTYNAGPLPSANPSFNVPVPGTTTMTPGTGGRADTEYQGPGLDPSTGNPTGTSNPFSPDYTGGYPTAPTDPSGSGNYQGPGLNPTTGMPTVTPPGSGTPTNIFDKIVNIGKALSPFLGPAASLGGAAISANSNTEAAKIQAAEADKALALQKQIYDTTRGDLGPYRDIGGAAVGQLGYGLGLPGYESGKAPAQPTPSPFSNPVVGGPGASQSQIQPGTRTVTNTPGSMSNATGSGNTINPYFTAGQQAAGGGMVTVKAPNGSVGQIPANRLNEALAAGGQVVA